jgi:hypothetical protein
MEERRRLLEVLYEFEMANVSEPARDDRGIIERRFAGDILGIDNRFPFEQPLDHGRLVHPGSGVQRSDAANIAGPYASVFDLNVSTW